MRFVALAIILAALPIFISWLNGNPARRTYAMLFIGVGFFLSGVVQIEASFISWPMWTGTVRGATVSLIDVMALALVLTRRRDGLSTPLLWVALVYVVTVALSIMLSTVPMASFFYLFQIARATILFVAVASELGNPMSLRRLLQGMSIGLLIQAGYVISQKLGGTVQAHGTMIHQNTLGIMTELVILPLVGALLGGLRDKIYLAGVAAGLLIVAAGGSRATLAITVVSIAILLLLSIVQNSNPTKMKIAGLGVLLCALTAPLAMATMSARFGTGAVIESDQSRLAMERAAESISADHPFGIGANMYVSVANTGGFSARNGVSWGGNLRSVPVHNAYLLARSETGWIGEFAFLALFLVPIIAGLRYAFKSRTSLDGSIALGSAVALAAVAFHSQFEFVAQSVGPQGLVFINIGIVAAMLRLHQFKARHRPAVKATGDKVAQRRVSAVSSSGR